MSSDLFAAFASQATQGTPQSPRPAESTASSTIRPASQPSQPFSFFDDLGTREASRINVQDKVVLQTPKFESLWSSFDSSRPPDVAEDAEDWGDFEGAPEPQPPTATVPSYQAPYAAQERTQPLVLPAGQDIHVLTGSSTPIANTAAFHNRPSATPSQTGTQHATQTPLKQHFAIQPASEHGLSVLFDATELGGGDDDFGDFETPAAHSGLDSSHFPDERSKPYAKAGCRSRSKDCLTMPSATSQPTPRPPPTVQKSPSWEQFAEWDEQDPSTTNDTSNAISSPILTLSPMTPAAESSSSDQEPPPTNIPPPGILLSLFPMLFSEAQERLFKPMAAQTFSMKNRILSDPNTIDFLRGYLAIAVVVARVIAGRKLRWKRDVHLAQGMRLGPASSRATSGMKLRGIDKSEINKEEREALDVVRAWKDQIGRLRSAVAAANAIKPGCLGPVPDIQEVLPVKVLREAEGGVPAPQQCALCGLKREERVAKVDLAVEDSFGEWWVEQTRMHRGCKNFWKKNKEALRQR